MKLDELQVLFVNDVVSNQPHDQTLLQKIRQDRNISAEMRLDVYRSTIRGIHFNVLDETYPVTLEVLGKKYWHQLLSNELCLDHQTTKDINQFGSMIPALLSKLSETRTELKDYVYIGDLAQLEWLVHQSSLSDDHPPFNWQRFMALSPEQQMKLRLKTSNSLKLLWSTHPVDELWVLHKDEANSTNFEQAPHGIHCCIYRDGFNVKVARLDNQQLELLQQIENLTLAELQTEYQSDNDVLISQIFAMIKRGWIVDFEEMV